jgi:hypothetical protein
VNAPKYWLYRGRFVREEGAKSEPDTLVELLDPFPEDVSATADFPDWVGGIPETEVQKHIAKWRKNANDPIWVSARADLLERLLLERGVRVRWTRHQLEGLIRDVVARDVLPKSHSQLAAHTPEELVLRVKHVVLSAEQDLRKLRREVEAFENFEKLTKTPRERIPDDTRLFVWQRDRGCCARCGSRERIELDHIVPIAEGGSNTARNIELLCEKCNRAKGASV